MLFDDFDIRGSRFLANADAVDTGAFGTQRTTKFDDSGSSVAGIADADDRADLERFGLVLDGH